MFSVGVVSFRQRDKNVKPGSRRRLRVDRDLASEMKHPLAHAHQPKPPLALDQRGVETSTVIDDPQRDHVRVPAQLDLDMLRTAVLDGIRQRLLGDAIHAHSNLRRNR